MAAFTAGVEQRLNGCLRAGTIPDADLVDAIAVANKSPRFPESARDCPNPAALILGIFFVGYVAIQDMN